MQIRKWFKFIRQHLNVFINSEIISVILPSLKYTEDSCFGIIARKHNRNIRV